MHFSIFYFFIFSYQNKCRVDPNTRPRKNRKQTTKIFHLSGGNIKLRKNIIDEICDFLRNGKYCIVIHDENMKNPINRLDFTEAFYILNWWSVDEDEEKSDLYITKSFEDLPTDLFSIGMATVEHTDLQINKKYKNITIP